jgi:hypothetical protein
MTNLKPKSVRSTLFVVVAAALTLSVVVPIQAATPATSGVYLTATDHKNGRLVFEGDCKSKAHRLNLHDVLNKPYVDVTHESEKRRYSESDLFGFRACDGHGYRFSTKLEYQILESRDLYVYSRERYTSHGKVNITFTDYFFSVGPDGPILSLTLENLKQAFPGNHKYRDLLDANFGAGQSLEEFEMFKINRLLSIRENKGPDML